MSWAKKQAEHYWLLTDLADLRKLNPCWPCLNAKWECKSLVRVQVFATHRLHSPWNSPGQNTGVGSVFLLRGIFPTQGSNPGLPHSRQIPYQLSHKGSPRTLEWVAYPFSAIREAQWRATQLTLSLWIIYVWWNVETKWTGKHESDEAKASKAKTNSH